MKERQRDEKPANKHSRLTLGMVAQQAATRKTQAKKLNIGLSW